MDIDAENLNVQWKTLALIEEKLTRLYVDNELVRSHKIDVGEWNVSVDRDAEQLDAFLESQYQLSRRIVSYDPVEYLGPKALVN